MRKLQDRREEALLALVILGVFVVGLVAMALRPGLTQAVLVFIELAAVPALVLDALSALNGRTLFVAYLWALGPALLVERGVVEADGVLLMAAFMVVGVLLLHPWLVRCRQD